MFNGQSGGWAWYPGNTTPAHLALPPTPTATNLSGQIARDELQKRGKCKKIFRRVVKVYENEAEPLLRRRRFYCK